MSMNGSVITLDATLAPAPNDLTYSSRCGTGDLRCTCHAFRYPWEGGSGVG